MSIEIPIAEIAETFGTGESLVKDAAFLKEFASDGLSVSAEKDAYLEYLVGDERSGSAKCVDLFNSTNSLEQQVDLLEQGKYDPEALDRSGMPGMIDVEGTTQEMLGEEKVLLNKSAKEAMFSQTTSLYRALENHIDESAGKAAEYYAQDFIADADFEIPEVEATEIGFSPSPQELIEIETVKSGLTSEMDQSGPIKKVLMSIMKRRPESIGLGNSADLAHELLETSTYLGEDYTDGIPLENIRNLRDSLQNKVNDELQMHPGFNENLRESTDAEIKGILEESSVEEEPIQEQSTEVLQGEVVYHQNEWLTDDIDENTKNWLNENGHENVSGAYTEDEQHRANEYRDRFNQEFKNQAENSEEPGVRDILGELFDGEGDFIDEAKDASELLLRVAVKVGISLAVSIARNIAKDKDTPQEVRIMMGVFADGLDKAGDYADMLITGDKDADLRADIIAFITDKYN